jgi:RNA polymerase sigma-70 factor (sigma-E family)
VGGDPVNTVADVDVADAKAADVRDAPAIIPAQDLVAAEDPVTAEVALPGEDIRTVDGVLSDETVVAAEVVLTDEAVLAVEVVLTDETVVAVETVLADEALLADEVVTDEGVLDDKALLADEVVLDEVVVTNEGVVDDEVVVAEQVDGAGGDGTPGAGDLGAGDLLVDDDNNGINFAADGEPPNADARPTRVTETLAASALVPEIAFVSEPKSTSAVWDAGQAVTEIYRGHYSQLVRLALLLVHDVQTAEEVVQDAFVSMNDAWRRLHDAEKALSYLRQTVVNRSRSVLRHRKVVDMHAPKPAPDEPSAEQAAMAVLESDAVGAALRTLPERQREAIVLRYYLDLSEADIAKTMGISRGAVKSHTARAMAALKSILQQETS